ncbi:DUF1534 domain-containing protein [Pseudomonas tremae]|nr:DUF1534 domain-containing protein [Pseudomonas tremae]MCF5806780.1 DUF1534 domain-containing protein [Pseudomonas tremae]
MVCCCACWPFVSTGRCPSSSIKTSLKRTQSLGAIVRGLSFSLQRGDAFRDAPRQNFSPRRKFKVAPTHAAATPIPRVL